MLVNHDETDGFDDELPKDGDSLEAEPESVKKGGESGEDSTESPPDDPIVQIGSPDALKAEPSSPLAPVRQGSALFQSHEQSNHAYATAVTAYYEERNYQQAIEKFDEAIRNAADRIAHDLPEEHVNEIIAKSLYWQAEAYVKMQDIPQALEVFRSLIQKCHGHYLTLAALRRVNELSAKNA